MDRIVFLKEYPRLKPPSMFLFYLRKGFGVSHDQPDYFEESFCASANDAELKRA
tara:strand:+ start:29 stop:190 length:162 start_codon:yes stop_codon:yes gene_type:complete